MYSKNKKILIVAAHPDDEILGCGATAARLIKEGNSVFTLILGEGTTSRDKTRNRRKRNKELLEMKEQSKRANRIIGIKYVFFCDLPDNRFDSRPVLDIIKIVESVKNKIKPDIIYTHCAKDLNIDHRITYSAVLTACRPVREENVKEIYGFEIPSSSEWNYPHVFNPNMYVDISDTLELKIKALRCYKGEIREFPHPRSEESVRNIAKRWGSVAGLYSAEAFEVTRTIV
jgi:LmbE family N-acetylglucosaminyl deacetylase